MNSSGKRKQEDHDRASVRVQSNIIIVQVTFKF
jgi:hypothetical protein